MRRAFLYHRFRSQLCFYSRAKEREVNPPVVIILRTRSQSGTDVPRGCKNKVGLFFRKSSQKKKRAEIQDRTSPFQLCVINKIFPFAITFNRPYSRASPSFGDISLYIFLKPRQVSWSCFNASPQLTEPWLLEMRRKEKSPVCWLWN